MTVSTIRRPAHEREDPLRLKPHRGRPRCLVEHALQHVWHRRLAWYVAFMVTVGVVIQLLIDHHFHQLVYG